MAQVYEDWEEFVNDQSRIPVGDLAYLFEIILDGLEQLPDTAKVRKLENEINDYMRKFATFAQD
jgi:hypothetical protein|tara:strand:- start:310 stop:501 length:192 start_codon:yes stop_codon:yes gene_type:complete